MINSIPTIESKNSVFGDITAKKSPNDYWLSNSTDIKKKKNKDENKITLMTPEEARATKNPKLIGLSIAGATILTAAGLFFLLKGGPKGINKNFKKFRNYLDAKVQNAKLNNYESGFTEKVYADMVSKLDGLQHRFDAVNNFTTFKDMLFKKIMYSNFGLKYFTKKFSFGKKIHDGITRMFEKIGRQSVVNSYKKTVGQFTERELLCNQLEKKIFSGNSYETVTINGIKRTKAQWLMQIKQMNGDLAQEYNLHFGKGALNGRYLKIKKVVASLNDCFDNLKRFWSTDTLNFFIADSVISKEKELIHKDVFGFRKKLSYSLADMVKESDDKVMKLTQFVGYKDKDKLSKLNTLKKDLKLFTTAGQNTQELSSKISTELDKLRISILKDSSIDEKSSKSLLEGIEDLRSTVLGFKQGKVENILDIYKRILSPEDFERVQGAYKKSVKYLDKSINTETDDFMSKVRDLTTGGAPTDVLTLVGSFATLGYQLGKSDNNEERVSISLKYGIPAVFGIGVSLYCNAKLCAGTKSMLIASISGLILNKIGSFADSMLKKYLEQRKKVDNVVATQQKTNNNEEVSKLNVVSPQNT